MTPLPTCTTCGQPITTTPYLVTWTLKTSPPTNIYAHPGPCAAAANRLYCTPSPPHLTQLPLLPSSSAAALTIHIAENA